MALHNSNIKYMFLQFMSIIKSVGEDMQLDELTKLFRDEGMSNYFVVYLRLITSCQLQLETEFYENFVTGGKSVVDFCKTVSCLCSYKYFLPIFCPYWTLTGGGTNVPRK